MTQHFCILNEYASVMIIPGPLQAVAVYRSCFGKAQDKLQEKVVTHLEKLNGDEF